MKFIHERTDLYKGIKYSKSVIIIGNRKTSLNEEVQRSVVEEIVREAVDNNISIITTGFLGVDSIVSEVCSELGADLIRVYVKMNEYTSDGIEGRLSLCINNRPDLISGIPIFIPIIVTDYAIKKSDDINSYSFRYTNVAIKKNGYSIIMSKKEKPDSEWGSYGSAMQYGSVTRLKDGAKTPKKESPKRIRPAKLGSNPYMNFVDDYTEGTLTATETPRPELDVIIPRENVMKVDSSAFNESDLSAYLAYINLKQGSIDSPY